MEKLEKVLEITQANSTIIVVMFTVLVIVHITVSYKYRGKYGSSLSGLRVIIFLLVFGMAYNSSVYLVETKEGKSIELGEIIGDKLSEQFGKIMGKEMEEDSLEDVEGGGEKVEGVE